MSFSIVVYLMIFQTCQAFTNNTVKHSHSVFHKQRNPGNSTTPDCQMHNRCPTCLHEHGCYWCEENHVCSAYHTKDIFPKHCAYNKWHYHNCYVEEVLFVLVIVMTLMLVLISLGLLFYWHLIKYRHNSDEHQEEQQEEPLLQSQHTGDLNKEKNYSLKLLEKNQNELFQRN